MTPSEPPEVTVPTLFDPPAPEPDHADHADHADRFDPPDHADRPDPPDQAERDRITADLDTTLFVEAGAGSGKTTALVARVLALVEVAGVELAHIAAITFTEKAGDELRDRIRRALEDAVLDAGRSEPARALRLQTALEQLDGSAIGTLHSFAQRILREHPIEAGLPPRVEVLDEVSSAVAFDQRWARFQDQLLSDRALERSLLLLFATGVRPDALRSLASAFEDNWDLVETHVPVDVDEPPPVRPLVAPAVTRARSACAEPCRDPGDGLARRMAEITAWLDELDAASDDIDLLEKLDPDRAPSFRITRTGRKDAYDCDIDELRREITEVGAELMAVRADVAQACVRRVATAIRDFTLDAARERRGSGQLQFHDLLVLARSLLADPRHGAAVRRRLHHRYRRILLDEFQDTDPIQIELAVRIAASDPGSDAAATDHWSEVPVDSGQLFFVGDPKQSIYRFRRADISTFLGAAQRFAAAGGAVGLTANFRTVVPIIDWLNATFGALMDPGLGGRSTDDGPDAGRSLPSQAPYAALEALRPEPPAGPTVSIVGRDPLPRASRADEIRAAEARSVAATITRILAEGWSVDAGGGRWRPAGLGDITVLVPARTSLPFLEDALDARGVPFRAESSSLVYATRAVRDVLMVLRAVDDPTNRLHLLAALRTPLLACGDDDLFRFRVERRGRLDLMADQPDTVPADDPVAAALGFLHSVWERRQWDGPAELIDRVVRERRALELGFTEGRPRDGWRRLRFLADQARNWSDATGGNLRQYLQWVDRQAGEGARVAEAVLPETDDDAVRIMTIHSAKGLEFPVTIVSGLSTRPQRRQAGAQVVFRPDGATGYKLGRAVETDEYSEWKPIDEQMAFHERIRLLYVACTRARDHLVVSVHRAERTGDGAADKLTNAELLVHGMGDRAFDALPDAAADTGPVGPVPVPPPTPPPPFAEWEARRSSALAAAARPTVVAATALTDEGEADTGELPPGELPPGELPPGESPPGDATTGDDAAGSAGSGGPEPEGADAGLRKRPRDLDLPPWLKGRYGTAVGRAVHGVLQTVDLSGGGDVDAAVAAQCEAEAVTGRDRDVRALVARALTSPSVVAAAAAPHWRELYVCVPVGDRLLEGYIDLLYRGPAGLVVVDYKTAATADPAELDRRVEGYRNQGASYALAVAEATGEAVVDVVFCFLTPAGAVERHLPDLAAAVAEVRALVAAGREVVTT